MTVINALRELKSMGVTKLVGLDGLTEIDAAIVDAADTHVRAVKGAAQNDSRWQNVLGHENDHCVITTKDGHHLITCTAGLFDAAIFGDYDTFNDMWLGFSDFEIAAQAETLATEMDAECPDTLPHELWALIAEAELRKAYQAANEDLEQKEHQAEVDIAKKEGSHIMSTYNITYKRNDVYQAILVDATNAVAAATFFAADTPDAIIIATVPATRDDQKPGKPHLTATI